MSQNTFLYEKLALEHHQEMQREIEERQRLASLPLHEGSVGRHLVSRFGAMLVVLGTRLEQVEQRGGQVSRALDMHV